MASRLLQEFKLADLNGDGKCDFGEFVRYYALLKEDFGASSLSPEEVEVTPVEESKLTAAQQRTL